MSLKPKSARKGQALRFLLALSLPASTFAQAAGPWEQPAAQLCAQVGEILGSGQAQLLINNRSSIAATEVPEIQRLLEKDLKTRGVATSGSESANVIRVTLSENERERLWVAEVVEGSQTQVAMVRLDREPSAPTIAEAGMVLKRKLEWRSNRQDGAVLAVLEIHDALIVLEQEQIVFLSKSVSGMQTGWQERNRWNLGQVLPPSGDPRGLLLVAPDGNGFTAVTPGRECTGSPVTAAAAGPSRGDWNVFCQESDDPWPIATGPISTGSGELHAFYNASRDFFTGVITPSQGVDPGPFYALAVLPRPAEDHPALLVTTIDGKVKLIEGNALQSVSGTRDWGSDFAAMHSGCGAGTQIVASGSGEAASDSLRAYELPAQEAIAVSAPLDVGGTVTALWTASPAVPESIWAIVRNSRKEYEVDRVTALCP